MFVFPADYKGSIATINADETLFAGSKASDEQKEIARKYPEKSQFFDRIFDAHLPNDLFTINIKARKLNKIHTENTWLGHVQFSPTDPKDFFCTGGRNSGYWTKIAVPSHWEQQGFGSYNYGRDYKTYGKNSRFADEKGMYKTAFDVPASWKGKEVFIVFEGSMTDTEIKINGKKAGDVHQGAFYRFKYNITGKLQFGKHNMLEATVSKMSADASVNNAERLADYWVLGGIFRPVYLEAVPKEYIDYTAINAKVDGSFAIQVFTKGFQQARTVVADIVDAKGKTVATVNTKANKNDSVVELSTKVNNVLQWTAETPNLYRVNVYVRDAAKSLYQTTEKFGFRTIEVRHGDGIYINGVQIKMKGACRHVWWPETGRCVNAEIDLMDVQLLKEMNMNAVRCSYYPPDVNFLNVCDSLGLYVLDELAGWQKWYSTKAGEPLVKEMVTRDVNHPSIIFWDNGNEGGTNKELDDDFTKWDISQRPVIHPHHRPGNAFNGTLKGGEVSVMLNKKTGMLSGLYIFTFKKNYL